MDRIDGRILKDLREQAGYSLRNIAAKIYTSKSSVQRWEQSSLPENEETLHALADVFHTTVDDMRRQSQERYGKPATNEEQPPAADDTENDDDGLTAEQLAEMKFGIKWLPVPIIAATVIILFVLLMLFL